MTNTRTPWPVPAGLAVGVAVQVVDAATQKRGRLGGPHFPGRRGAISRRNDMAREDRGGLWYVALEPTNRACARAAPMQVREMVEAGTVSATLAVKYLRKHANEAGAALQADFDRAKSAGKGKVTKRFSADAQFTKFVRKTGSDLVSTLEVVKADAGFASLSEETRKRIEELVEQAAKARAAAAAAAAAAAENGDDKAEEAAQSPASGVTIAAGASEDAMQEAAIMALAGDDSAATGDKSAQAEPEFVAA